MTPQKTRRKPSKKPLCWGSAGSSSWASAWPWAPRRAATAPQRASAPCGTGWQGVGEKDGGDGKMWKNLGMGYGFWMGFDVSEMNKDWSFSKIKMTWITAALNWFEMVWSSSISWSLISTVSCNMMPVSLIQAIKLGWRCFEPSNLYEKLETGREELYGTTMDGIMPKFWHCKGISKMENSQ